MSSPTDEHPLLNADVGEKTIGAEDGASGHSSRSRAGPSLTERLDARQVAAIALIIAGFVAIAVGWYGISGTSQVWQQMPYFVSGGIGGAALVGLGVVCYVSYLHAEDRRVMKELLRRLDELELGLAGEFDSMADRLNGSQRESRSRA